MNDEQQAHLKLTICEDGSDPLVPVALSAMGSAPLKHCDFRHYMAPIRLRALCILLLLVKDREYQRAESHGRFDFHSTTKKRTWIGTLAGFDQGGKAISELFRDRFRLQRFWKGFRGGGKMPPHVSFFTDVLPPENIQLKVEFEDGTNRYLERRELRKLARMLEAQLIRKNEWEVALVPELFQGIDLEPV